MPLEASAELVGFDADAACERAQAVTGGGVLVCAEFTTESYKVLYLDERIEDHYGDRADALDRGTEVHQYESLDFLEREAFADMLGAVDEVRAVATFADVATVVRVVTETEGLYLSVDPGTDVTRLVDELEPIVAGENRRDPL